jgi:sialic acid synthase SpsE
VAAYEALACNGEKYFSQNIKEMVDTEATVGTVLLTVSEYPADAKEYESFLNNYKNIFVYWTEANKRWGISDHSLGLEVPRMAKRAGASVYECHVCYSHDDGGIDSKAAKTFEELAIICEEAK